MTLRSVKLTTKSRTLDSTMMTLQDFECRQPAAYRFQCHNYKTFFHKQYHRKAKANKIIEIIFLLTRLNH